MLTFEQFVENIPKLHTWDGGRTYNSGGMGKDKLICFKELLNTLNNWPSAVIETGATAIAFFLMSCDPVISITPEVALCGRIEHFISASGISQSGLQKVVDYSEFSLPQISGILRQQEPLIDLALIEGADEYPTVFADFCYMNSVVKQGAYLVVDDVETRRPGYPGQTARML